MRVMIVLILLIAILPVKAQRVLPGGYVDQLQQLSFAGNPLSIDSTPGKQWHLRKYMGISTGFGFTNGGNAMLMSVPVGIQLNRRVNNNWYAFAGIAVAPTYVNFNQSFFSANNSKFLQQNALFAPGRLELYSRAELGMMYINDQKTFSISGSIGIERRNYPFLPFNQAGTVRQPQFIAPNNNLK